MSIPDSFSGWAAALGSIMETGTGARSLPPFDAAMRQRDVDRQIAEIATPQPWMLVFVIPALLLPSGWIWALGVVGLWATLRYRAYRRRAQLAASLEEESSRLESAHRTNGRQFEREVIEPANRGELLALLHLMRLWHEARPESIRTFSARLDRSPGGGYKLLATGVHRGAIPDFTVRFHSPLGPREADGARPAKSLSWDGGAMVAGLDRIHCERAKYDEYLPESLLKEGFVVDHLDAAGAEAQLRRCLKARSAPQPIA